MTYAPKHRKVTPEDEAHRHMQDLWNAVSERNKVRYQAFEKPYCQEFTDCMDGFVIHAPTCQRYQDMASSGTGCVNPRHVSPWPLGLSDVK